MSTAPDWHRAEPEAPAPDAPPGPPTMRECGCGESWPDVWWTPRPGYRPHKGVSARWCRPKLDPCPSCEPDPAEAKAREEARQLAIRQERAGLASSERRWSFERFARPRDGEPPEDFRKRVKASPGLLGITPDNLQAARVLREWDWQRDGWIYIHGEPGTGKTVLAAALATRLVQGGGERWEARYRQDGEWSAWEAAGEEYSEAWAAGVVYRDEDYHGQIRMRRRPHLDGVLYITEEELWRRVTLGWTRDKDPLAQAHDARVLILDDLGMVRVRKALEEHAIVEKLVHTRYRDHRPTVFTSNVPWDRVGATYGDRVASRLREMVPEANRLVLRHYWRGR